MIESNTNPEDVDLECPSCGRAFADKWQGQCRGADYWWQIFGCRSCGGLLLVEFPRTSASIGALTDGCLVYPYAKASVTEGVPQKVGFNYDQAVRSYSAGAYNAATVMARASVEAVAQDKKAAGKWLHDRINWLNEQRIITPMLHEWAMSIKEWGNEAIHELEPINADTADYIVKFAWDLIEHLYVRPTQFDKIRRPPTSD